MSQPPIHIIKLLLGNKQFTAKVSTEGCSDVFDVKKALKKEFPALLHSYDSAQLTLFDADGTTQIDPETTIDKLKEVPWKPMIVKVEEVEQPAPQGITVLYPSFCLKFQKTIVLQGNVCRSFL